MATSSIFANFNITDPEKAERFIKALDESAKMSKKMKKRRKIDPNCYLRTPEEIDRFFSDMKSKE